MIHLIESTFGRDVGTEQYDKVSGPPEGITHSIYMTDLGDQTPLTYILKGVHTESMRELQISDPQSTDPDQPVRNAFFLLQIRLLH